MNNNWLKQLSKTYINLTEENNVEKLLEYKKPKTRYMKVLSVEPDRHEYTIPPTLVGNEVTQQGNPVGKGARQRQMFAYTPEYGSEIGNAAEDAAQIHPNMTNNPVTASMRGVGPAIPIDVTGRPDYGPEDPSSPYVRKRGGSVPGTGRKAHARALAAALAEIRAQEAALAAELAKHEEG